METKQPAVLTAKIFHDFDGETYAVKYRTIKELMLSIFFLLKREYKIFNDVDGNNVRVTLSDGKSFWWNETVAHYCFAKGRITEKDAFYLMFNTIEIAS